MNDLGTVVVDEDILIIDRIYLENGKINVQVHARGPFKLVGTKMLRLHSPDGALVLRSEKDFNLIINEDQNAILTWDFSVPEKRTIPGDRIVQVY